MLADDLQVGALEGQYDIPVSVAHLQDMAERPVGKRGIPHQLSRNQLRFTENSLLARELLTDGIPENLFALDDVKKVARHGTADRQFDHRANDQHLLIVNVCSPT